MRQLYPFSQDPLENLPVRGLQAANEGMRAGRFFSVGFAPSLKSSALGVLSSSDDLASH